MSATGELIAFVQNLDYAELPEAVRQQARRCVLDLIGAAIAGCTSRMARASTRFAYSQFSPGSVTVIGAERSLGVVGATWVNGISASALDLDDGHRLAMGHPGASVIPTALAVAEATNASGTALLTAIVAGYEVAVRVSVARTPLFKEHQYSTGIWGGFGAVAAAAKLLEFDTLTFQHAFGITLGHAPFPPSGSYTNYNMVKEGIGWAGVAGCSAALLAQQGFEGPKDGLDQSGRYDTAQLVEDLGQDYAILKTYFKPYASCRWSHSALDGVLELVEQHGLQPQEVDKIRVDGFYEVTRLCDYAPSTTIAAQFSIPFCIALALLYGRVGPRELTENNLHNPELLSLARKVDVAIDPELDRLFPEKTVARVTVHTGRGSFKTTVEYPKGNPENPLSDDELADKFRTLTIPIIGEDRGRALEEAVKHLEEMQDLRQLTGLLA
ncbi:MAG TPA: MmgE/PrpD family protein, partial [Anaerolineae bacterium]|nr:MmgE/PrpD family protein [Anaerolineae bacterium]